MSISISKHNGVMMLFLKNRIKRIYPLYLFVSAPFLLVDYFKSDNTDRILSSLFFVGGDMLNYKDPILFVGWTLFFEFFLYFDRIFPKKKICG
jgi:peptidoglycan/LPS O-acetylase OafA/YrhL